MAVAGKKNPGLTRISHQDLEFWGKLAKQVERSTDRRSIAVATVQGRSFKMQSQIVPKTK